MRWYILGIHQGFIRKILKLRKNQVSAKFVTIRNTEL